MLSFLLSLTKDNKQATKRNRYSVLASFYNFSINTELPSLTNPCKTAVIKKIFKRPLTIQWQIVDKETVDEIIFRTMNTRNRLMLELMARGGMRVGEVLNLMPVDIQERSLAIQNPKSGRTGEIVYVPRKLLVRLVHWRRFPLAIRGVPLSLFYMRQYKLQFRADTALIDDIVQSHWNLQCHQQHIGHGKTLMEGQKMSLRP